MLDPTALLLRAKSLWQRGEVAPARALLEEILKVDPVHPEAVPLMASLMQSQGELNAASQLMAKLCRDTHLSTATTMQCARFIQQCQRQSLAASLCEEALACGHGSPELLVLAGNLARELGEFDRARIHYIAALESGVDLDTWFVYGALAATRRYCHRDDPDFARFTRHFNDPRCSLESRAATGLGLAKAYDDIGDYARAASILGEANRLSREVQPWSRAASAKWMKERMLSGTLMSSPRATGSDFVPVFIVGLPRSGTTLLATRLSAHPEVCDRGELPMLGYIAERMRLDILLHDANALHQAAELYRKHAVQDDPPVRWYIDKNPNNFRYLDLAVALFPQARIIHCRRDPRDTALSIWSQSFAHPQYGFANDLDDIADFMQSHDLLMKHWAQELRIPMQVLDYEAMVGDPESTLRTLSAYIGLPEATHDANIQASSTAAITSASVWQARQPVYRTSIGRWRNYAPFVPRLAQF